jgi:hypothetical protein
MTNEFKAGDYVRCISTGGNLGLEVGEEYVVIDARQLVSGRQMVELGGVYGTFYSSRFEPVIKEEKMPMFKVGDRVRAIDAHGNIEAGDIITVGHVEVQADGDVFIGSTEEDEASWYSFHYELVNGFIKGDKLLCVEGFICPDLTEGKVYEAMCDEYTSLDQPHVKVIDNSGYIWSCNTYRFTLATEAQPVLELVEMEQVVEVEAEPMPQLTLSCGGVTITLDPSIAFSRKFAEAFINAVYS